MALSEDEVDDLIAAYEGMLFSFIQLEENNRELSTLVFSCKCLSRRLGLFGCDL